MMKRQAIVLLLLLTLWLVSAVPAPVQLSAPIPEGLTAAEWHAIQDLVPGSYIKASNTGADDQFGSSVAIDGSTMVVGAYLEDSNATGIDGDQTNDLAPNSGAAYVFVRMDGVWSQQAYLKASNAEAWDYFGGVVAVHGDTIVVGAGGESSNATGVNGNQTDNSAFEAGAVYVFTRTDDTWTQQAYLKASNSEAEDGFGWAIDIWGDTIVVGAGREDSEATGINGDQMNNLAFDSGAVYVFSRTDGVWSQQAYLKSSNTDAYDLWGGHSIAIAGDTVVVGSIFESSSATGIDGDQMDNSAGNAGAAYVFTRTDGVWNQQAYLKASNTDAEDLFGFAVAISGETIVIGAVDEASNATGVDGDQTDNSALFAGAAYVFVRTDGIWSQQAYLKASNTEQNDLFGESVAIDGQTIVVGAFGEASNATGVNGNQADNSAYQAGAGYIFTRSGGVWSQQTYLKASNTNAGDRFGESMAIDAPTIVAGAHFESSNATGIDGDQTDNSALWAGAVYTFEQEERQVSVEVVGAGQVVSEPAGIDCGETCTADFVANRIITLTATADIGSTFTGWSGDVFTTTNPITVTMDSDKFITATFALNQYELNVATVGNGTAVPNSGTYDYGTVVTLTATADLGSTFLDWSGDVASTTNPVTVTMDSDKFITATFALQNNTYQVFLPLVTKSLAIQLGADSPIQPVGVQGNIFYTNTVQIPADLPTGGQYYLSSSSGGLLPVVVDDRLLIEVDGQTIFSQEFGQPPSGLILPLAPEIIAQMAGNLVTIYYQDVHGQLQGANAVWLIWLP